MEEVLDKLQEACLQYKPVPNKGVVLSATEVQLFCHYLRISGSFCFKCTVGLLLTHPPLTAAHCAFCVHSVTSYETLHGSLVKQCVHRATALS